MPSEGGSESFEGYPPFEVDAVYLQAQAVQLSP